jgi:hypothetical protein
MCHGCRPIQLIERVNTDPKTATMDYQDLVSRISAMTLDPAQQYLLHDSEGRIHQDAGPTILLDGGENEEEEEEEEEILQDQVCLLFLYLNRTETLTCRSLISRERGGSSPATACTA